MQQKFLELDPKPQWDGKDLDLMSKQEYVDMKHEGILEGTVKPMSQREGGQGRRERRGSGEHFDKDDWKSRRDRDQGENRRGGDRGGRGGRGRGGRGRGDRGGRGRGRGREDRGGGRNGRDRRGSNEDEGDRVKRENGDLPPRRAQAEADKSKMDVDDAPPAAAAKKRAREDDGENGGEAKKAKEDVAA